MVGDGVDGGDDHGVGVGRPGLHHGRRVHHQRDLAPRVAHVGEELRRPPQQRVLAGQRQVLEPVMVGNFIVSKISLSTFDLQHIMKMKTNETL